MKNIDIYLRMVWVVLFIKAFVCSQSYLETNETVLQDTSALLLCKNPFAQSGWKESPGVLEFLGYCIQSGKQEKRNTLECKKSLAVCGGVFLNTKNNTCFVGSVCV